MENNYFTRLIDEIQSDGRSLRGLSMEAGLGENFISQMIKSGTQPAAHNLLAILNTLGGNSMAYVLLNIRISHEHIQMLQDFESLSPAAQQNFRNLLHDLAVGEGVELQQPVTLETN